MYFQCICACQLLDIYVEMLKRYAINNRITIKMYDPRVISDFSLPTIIATRDKIRNKSIC